MHPITSSQTFNNNKNGKSKSFANDGTGNIESEWSPFPRSRSFEVIFPDKVPIIEKLGTVDPCGMNIFD